MCSAGFPECPDRLCTYVRDPSFASPEEDESFYSLLHSPCDNCPSQTEQEPLCKFCRHLRLRHLAICLRGRLEFLYIERENPDAISRILSTQRCTLCNVIASTIRAHSIIEGRNSEYIWPKTYGWKLMLRQSCIAICLDGRLPAAKVFYGQSPALFPSATARINWSPIREQISRCSLRASGNMKCPPQGFRLIDVNNRRLVSISDFSPTAKLGSDVKFVALSYVWGNTTVTEHNALLECNKSKLSAVGGLGPGNIPRVVEDSILVCQELHQPFLWVDRYCIQQDLNDDQSGSKGEKQAQIDAIGDIFSSAEFTIIHANGTHLDDPIPGVSSEREVLQTRGTVCGLEFISGYPNLSVAMTQSRWNKRGWTYQESVLCSKRLIFTSHEVWLECNDEDSPRWREHFPESTIKVESDGLLGHMLVSGSESCFDNFRRHLGQYTARSLTYKSDTVNAFTGILAALYDGDLGIYGLPEEDFDRALLWNSFKKPLISTSDKEGLPSWSWASASANSIISVSTTADYGCLKGPLVRWTYTDPTGQLKAINSGKNDDWQMAPHAYFFAAWWKGCIEASVPDEIIYAPANCSQYKSADPVQRRWINTLWEHLGKRETCQECESYISEHWLSESWTHVRRSAELEETYDKSLADNLRPGALLTRAQTAHFRVGKSPFGEYSKWCFVDTLGHDIGKIIPEKYVTAPFVLQEYLHGDFAECIGISISDVFGKPAVNVLIIYRGKKLLSARRVGVGYIYLWEWVKADREFEYIALE